MLPFVPESARRILDVGCSVGNFGALIKQELAAEVSGVEIDPEAAEIAKNRLDEVYCGAFNSSLGLPANAFDCIVFNDVLEHMVDPYGALEYTKSLLTPNGTVVASIPNVRYFGNLWMLMVHKNWKYLDSGILDRTHLRFFTEKSVRELFEDRGYHVQTLKGINSLEPWFERKYRFMNLIALGHLSDTRWIQFAVVASPAQSNPANM